MLSRYATGTAMVGIIAWNASASRMSCLGLALSSQMMYLPYFVFAMAISSFTDQAFQLLDDERDYLEKVPDDAVVGHLEDGGVRVIVDGDDAVRGLHAGQVLDGPRDAAGDVEPRANGLAGLAHLVAVGHPPLVHRRPRGAERRPQHLRQLLQELEVLRLAQPAPAGDDDVGVLQLDRLGDVLDEIQQLRPGGDALFLEVHFNDLALAGRRPV